MSRRRQQQRAEKARRHAQLPWPTDHSWSAPEQAIATPPRVAVRAADEVKRLAYTRSQAAKALGISPATLRRLLPYIETIELPWGSKLIPVDELERLIDERRQTPKRRAPGSRGGRPQLISPKLAERIRAERAAGKSLRRIAAGLNTDGTPTARGGRRWWPSTVRAVLVRAESNNPSHAEQGTPARLGPHTRSRASKPASTSSTVAAHLSP